MRLLLDTHIALWAIVDSPRLSTRARGLILDPANSIYVSTASVWEITIKHMLGKGDMPVSGTQAAAHFHAAGYVELPIVNAHIALLETLPPHHADPFDRLLVAQALAEPLRLLTHDDKLRAYSDNIILV
ncbi:MAG: type II toxin-antitoxin system VapC family toxin [Rhodanobacteraceae bacterium]|nr:type II toxin-antitoxin system VapC family toxin [Rhodanobacteraceae bacterium]